MRRPFLPYLLLLCVFLAFTFARDAVEFDHADESPLLQRAKPLGEHAQSVKTETVRAQEYELRREVAEAWSLLRETKPQTGSKLQRFVSKPRGMLGNAVYYAKEAFVLLFMNAPKHKPIVTTVTQEQPVKLGQPLSRAITLLEDAANDNDPDAMYLLAELNFHGNHSHPVNYDTAFKRYKQLSDLDGNSTAQYMVAFIYATGLAPSVPMDQARSMLYHTFAAEQGNTRSQMTLGYRNMAGIAAPKNCDEAVHWYKQVADKAILYYRSGPPGGHSLFNDAWRIADEEGGVYGEGASVTSAGLNAKQGGPTSDAYANVDDVLEYLHLQSSKGDLKSTFGLARVHYDGTRGLKRNAKIAKQHFMDVAREYWTANNKVKKDAPRSTERLASKAAGYLGRMFLRGEGTKQDFAKAKLWFKRGLANGDALCQYMLGLMYLEGYGVERNIVKASDFFAAAADQDLAVAQTHLGVLFLDQGDTTTAAKYFELAARNSHIEAFYYLAEINHKGIGRDKSCGTAAAYYKIVAEKAEAVWSGLSEAVEAYDDGEPSKAFMPYLMAAEQGCESAQANVAWLLDQAQPKSLWSPLYWLSSSASRTKQALGDAALALMHWTRSAKQQNIDAFVKMGDYHLAGLGTAVSPENAVQCYQAAAETLQSAQAMWNLGWMHENGVGIAQDFHLAKRFYDQALEINREAYLPVTLSLFKLRWRSWWNGVTGGSVHGIEDEQQTKKTKSFAEWLKDFLNADAAYYQDFEGYEVDDWDGTEAMPGGDWDENGEINDEVMETLLIGGLLAALAGLFWYRQQRAREVERRRRDALAAQQDQEQPPRQQDQQQEQLQAQDRGGLFPPPDDPNWNNWVAGGIGH